MNTSGDIATAGNYQIRTELKVIVIADGSRNITVVPFTAKHDTAERTDSIFESTEQELDQK